MKVLIKQATIVDPGSTLHLTTQDILIVDGSISAIDKNIASEADQTIAQPGLHVSPGWIDIFAHFGDPGFEYKETLESGANAAAAGGFTDVMVLPNTAPVTHQKSNVEYIVRRSNTLPVNIHPIGAISKNTEGKDLAEMYDMHASGAVAFSDGIKPVQSAGILLKALQYVKALDGVIIQIPDDRSVGSNGLMHEGIISTQLGLPGKPALAEELMVERDIKLADYTQSKLHFTGISSARSLELIKNAKEKGIQVTCSVTPYHLLFTEDDLKSYDTNLKVNPPLRGKEDRDALAEGVKSGLIDAICSHHLPQDIDHKIVEFEYAENGMNILQITYSLLKKALPGIKEETIVNLLSKKPREIFGFAPVTVQKDQPAQLTLFNPEAEFTFTKSRNRSKSVNNPFLDSNFIGAAIGIINGKQVYLNS